MFTHNSPVLANSNCIFAPQLYKQFQLYYMYNIYSLFFPFIVLPFLMDITPLKETQQPVFNRTQSKNDRCCCFFFFLFKNSMPRTRLNHLDALSRLASLSPDSLSPVLFIWALYFYLFIWLLLFFLLFTNFVCSKFSYYWIVFLLLFCFIISCCAWLHEAKFF